MKIYYYSVTERSCTYRLVDHHGYVLADSEDDAKRIVSEEYDDQNPYIEERSVIELN